MKAFFTSLGRRRAYAAGVLFWAYFVNGLALIMLGALLPDLRAAYRLDYQRSGLLLSVQSVGFLLIGLLTGVLAVKLGLKRAYLLLFSFGTIGLCMLLTSGAPRWLLAAMFFIGLTKGAVTDYHNRIISDYAHGSAQPLNLLHACFAVGACLAPIVVLACKQAAGADGWRLALLLSIALHLSVLALGAFMRLDPVQPRSADAARSSFGFLRERLFWQTTAIGFFYQAIEASFVGWLTSYFLSLGVMGEGAAQLVTAVLWVSLLCGRFACALAARRFPPFQMILAMCVGILVCLCALLRSHTLPTLLLSTIGLGLCMSGMYGTSVANAGDTFSRYPVCMGLFVTLIALGATFAPTAVGALAGAADDMRLGMSVLLAAAVPLLAAAVLNARYFRARRD